MPTPDRTRTKGKRSAADTVERRLDERLQSLLDEANKLSALSHSGKWPKTQMVAARDTALKVAEHALTIGEIIRGWR